jgi:FXSXX-COOH protein
MNVSEKSGTAVACEGVTDLRDLTLDELAEDPMAADIVARLTRKNGAESEPVRVAAFNSFI